ncbi:MAG: nucleoside deaminase [bacterium]|nr:nucleoside deaminase [bacterium]
MYKNDIEIMSLALDEAKSAYKRGECPVGAVIVQNGKIIAHAGNRETELKDPTAHAEILVLREAGKILDKHTFPDCVVYSTLWPCPMCANALLRAKVPKIICGAESFKYIDEETFNSSHLTRVGPIMNTECRDIFIKWVKDTGREFILGSKVSNK